VTFAIATTGRGQKLRALVSDFLAQNLFAASAELLVLVNGGVTVAEVVTSMPPGWEVAPVRVVASDPAGLMVARFRAARESIAPWIWFLDDDVRLPSGFVATAVRVLGASQKCAFGGGPLFPAPTVDLPQWLSHPTLLGDLALFVRGDNDPTKAPVGANYFIRRERLLELETDVLAAPYVLGRTETSLLSCDEIDLSERLLRGGAGSSFVAEAWVYHDIHTERLSGEWFRRRAVAEGVSVACLYRNRGVVSFLRFAIRTLPGAAWHGARYLTSSTADPLLRIVRMRDAVARTAWIPHAITILAGRPLPRL
jgi:hypothetical protein